LASSLSQNTAPDLNKKSIPAKLVSFTDEISQNFKSSGEKSSSNRKAHGTLTIYNEYSSTPQSLVATTRFLSTDGKLFRLVSGTVIPGMTNENGEMKPGAVEAEVVADEAGESFNIEASSFTIPGFQSSGGDKYTKFYAKSFKAMTGGGSGSDVAKAVSAGDIEAAKNKILTQFNAQIKEKAEEQSGQGYIVLEDALSVSEINYSFSNSVGDLTEEFTASVKAKISAMVFAEKDLKEIMKNMLEKSAGEGLGITDKTLTLDFGKADVDFNNGTIIIRVHGNGKTDSDVDLENLKKGILGKTNTELESYLKDYAEFSNVEVEYWPAFMSAKIPLYESRVEVVLDNN
jgi:hypothetical protein